MEYIVIARVNKIAYMVSVEAESNYQAEHLILDMGYCGRHEYGVETAQAFDRKTMKTDCFIAMALASKTVSQVEIMDIIERNNKRIELHDLAEKRVAELEHQMKLLSKDLENAKRVLAENP